mmetsp:Transcript_18575/g.33109  ORF Transcript_18575/g.33109 Transcript_18575/m.33109 type:complete len:147 (-) Transcript_18575:104-544(-)
MTGALQNCGAVAPEDPYAPLLSTCSYPHQQAALFAGDDDDEAVLLDDHDTGTTEQDKSDDKEDGMDEGSGGGDAEGGTGRWTTVLLICCLSGLIYSDQSLLAPNLTVVGEAFGLDAQETDVMAGDISAAIWVVVCSSPSSRPSATL